MKERDPFQEDAVGLLRVEEQQVWCFSSAGQLSSTSTALSLLLLKRKGEKIGWKGLKG